MMAAQFDYHDVIRDMKRELYYTVPHRRGIILGYHKVNLDSYYNDGEISEDTRILAHFELDKYYEKLN